MTTSKTGTGLGALAALACAACCALPILIGAGLLSGGAAAFFADRMPIIAIGLTALAVAAFTIAARRKTSSSGCGDTCDAKGGSGCAPTRT